MIPTALSIGRLGCFPSSWWAKPAFGMVGEARVPGEMRAMLNMLALLKEVRPDLKASIPAPEDDCPDDDEALEWQHARPVACPLVPLEASTRPSPSPLQGDNFLQRDRVVLFQALQRALRCLDRVTPRPTNAVPRRTNETGSGAGTVGAPISSNDRGIPASTKLPLTSTSDKPAARVPGSGAALASYHSQGVPPLSGSSLGPTIDIHRSVDAGSATEVGSVTVKIEVS